MNHYCQLMGHEWGPWKWTSGCGNKWTPEKGNMGPVHTDKRECLRCAAVEYVDDLPGKWGDNFDYTKYDTSELRP